MATPGRGRNTRARLAVLASIAGLTGPALAELPDHPFPQAVSYCRDHPGGVRLNDDRTVACFDGRILDGHDLTPILNLAQGGLLVMRSVGGSARAAMQIADSLRDKNATVVIYDYCLSACAAFILIATAETYVTKGSLIAWHAPCNDGSSKHLTWAKLEARCRYHPLLRDDFFAGRLVDRSARRFVSTPQSVHVRKMVRMTYDGSAHHRDLFWMWHPRNYPRYLTTKITYEAYPASQDEVDALAKRFRLPYIIYDP